MDFLLRRAFAPATNKRPTGGSDGAESGIPPGLAAALLQLRGAASTCDWDSEDALTAMFRLMACAPWSAHDVRLADSVATGNDARSRQARADARAGLRAGTDKEPVPNDDFALCRAIGAVLDTTAHQRSKLRQWANLWTRWSFKAVAQLATRHGCAQGIGEAVAHCVVHGSMSHGGRRKPLCAQPTDDLHLDELQSDDDDV
jgi:hypothetical protein